MQVALHLVGFEVGRVAVAQEGLEDGRRRARHQQEREPQRHRKGALEPRADCGADAERRDEGVATPPRAIAPELVADERGGDDEHESNGPRGSYEQPTASPRHANESTPRAR